MAFFNTEGRGEDEYVIRVFTKDVVGVISKVSTAIAEAGGDIRNISIKTMNGYGFDRYIIKAKEGDVRRIVDKINGTDYSKVLSAGRRMDIIKDATTVDELDSNFELWQVLQPCDRARQVLHRATWTCCMPTVPVLRPPRRGAGP